MPRQQTRREAQQYSEATDEKHRTRFREGVLARDPVRVIRYAAPSTVADHYPKDKRGLIALASMTTRVEGLPGAAESRVVCLLACGRAGMYPYCLAGKQGTYPDLARSSMLVDKQPKAVCRPLR